MELNLFHTSDSPVDDNKVIISVLVNKNDIRTSSSDILENFSQRIPQGKGKISDTTVPKYDINDLIPDNRNFYTYKGSFPYPPCNENVDWIVFENPINISYKAYKKFRNIGKLNNNIRPIQSSALTVVYYNNSFTKSEKKTNKKKTMIQCRKASKPRTCSNNYLISDRSSLSPLNGGSINKNTWEKIWLMLKILIFIIIILVMLKICFTILRLLWSDGTLAGLI